MRYGLDYLTGLAYTGRCCCPDPIIVDGASKEGKRRGNRKGGGKGGIRESRKACRRDRGTDDAMGERKDGWDV